MHLAMDIKNYWDNKFREKGCVWGPEQSELANWAMEFLKGEEMNDGKVLDLGCGYGRDTAFFARQGYEVIGVDFSEEGIRKASELYPDLLFRIMDITAMDFMNEYFDAIFGNFILHLFVKGGVRKKVLSECQRILKPKGHLFLSLASVQDNEYGKGRRISRDAFQNERGVSKIYFSEDRVRNEFKPFFNVIRVEIVDEYHTHDKPHTHKNCFVYCKK